MPPPPDSEACSRFPETLTLAAATTGGAGAAVVDTFVAGGEDFLSALAARWRPWLPQCWRRVVRGGEIEKSRAWGRQASIGGGGVERGESRVGRV